MTWREEAIGDCRLICADCRDVLPTLGRVDAVVTDPPYGIGFKYESYFDSSENLDIIISDIVSRFVEYSKRSLIFCSHRNIWRFPPAKWVASISWNTTGSYGGLGVCQWTPVLFYGDDVPGFGSVNGKIKSDVIIISGGNGVGFRRSEIIDHPCPKPANIMAEIVLRYSMAGETVLDPFMGSGTTGVACVKLDRKFIGIEIEPHYYEIALRRIEEAYRQPRLFSEPQPQWRQMKLFPGAVA